MHKLNELKIWHKAIELATIVYERTTGFPREEKYGLISQMRRAAVSISSNIAEGAGRNTNKEFCHYLAMSNGSCYELQTQIIIAGKLKFLDKLATEDLLTMLDDLQKMNYKLQQSIISRL